MPVTREGAYEAHCGATDLQRISCRPSATRIKSRRCIDEPAIVSRFVSVSNALDRMRPDYAVIDTLAFESARQSAFVPVRSEEHTSELQSLMRISYAVFCLKKKNTQPYPT